MLISSAAAAAALGAAPDTGASPFIKDVTTESFMADVVEASQRVPVLVDFWASWCGPCKQLGPALEKAVAAQNGKVLLAKVDTDKHQQLAAGLQVQSLPSIFVFVQGRPVDGFVGALPESQVQQFVAQVVAQFGGALEGASEGEAGFDVEAALAQAEGFLAAQKYDHAEALFQEVLLHQAEHAGAYAGIVRAALAGGALERAKALAARAPEKVKTDKLWAWVENALALAERAAAAGPVDALAAAVQAAPDDLQARYDYALALYAAGQAETAIDALLEIIRRDRKWNEEAARLELLRVFDALGPMDPLVIATRKRLSAILFA